MPFHPCARLAREKGCEPAPGPGTPVRSVARMSLLLAVSFGLLTPLGGQQAPPAPAPFTAAWQAQGGGQSSDGAAMPGPHPEPLDPFHPDRATPAVPAYGGTLTIHIENLPSMLNV